MGIVLKNIESGRDRINDIEHILGPRNFSSVKVSKAEFEGGGWLVV
jgi:hypothetical protein